MKDLLYSIAKSKSRVLCVCGSGDLDGYTFYNEKRRALPDRERLIAITESSIHGCQMS